MTKKKWALLGLALAIVVLGCGALAALVLEGIVPLNRPDRTRYPVRGVDVSAWQGEIDWPLLVSQDVGFAFVKATEGSTFVDQQFARNWREAHATGLPVGAYHFFSYDSAGETQADNFIATVPYEAHALPPVVDVEFYGNKAKNPPPRNEVEPELTAMLARLEAHYGKKPILYATMQAYRLYIQDGYTEYPLWIRDVVFQPTLPDGRAWALWQYSNRGRLEGMSGRERFIDLNIWDESQLSLQN